MEHGEERQYRLAETDVDAYVRLYRAEYPGMVRLAFTLTGDGGAAEDVVQDAFALLQPRFGRVDNPGGYLRTTVVNLCRNRERRSQRARRADHHVPHPELSTLGANEMADALARLPYRQRAVLVLRYWADWSEVEIASALRCRPGTVKALASRALTRLRREIIE